MIGYKISYYLYVFFVISFDQRYKVFFCFKMWVNFEYVLGLIIMVIFVGVLYYGRDLNSIYF